MMLMDNKVAAIERLKREVEYETARSAAAEKREGELKAELEALKAELQRADRREENLKNAVNGWQQDVAALQCALRAKGDVKDDAKASVLREALAKAAEVFEGYACHHFLKGADEKAQANRAHAKMCRDALATDEK